MDYLAAIRRDSDRFYETADSADPTLLVPGCPEWTIADLVWHLGECHWFWGTDIETWASGPEEIEQAKPERPASYTDTIAWGRAQADRMIRLLGTTPDDVAVWTWALDESGPQRRLHPAPSGAGSGHAPLGHRKGRHRPAATDRARGCVRLDRRGPGHHVAVGSPTRTSPCAGSVHLHCTDTEGEWFVHPDGRVEPIHAKGDVAIRGTASDLLLALYTRVPIGDLDVVGDASVAHELLTRVNTE